MASVKKEELDKTVETLKKLSEEMKAVQELVAELQKRTGTRLHLEFSTQPAMHSPEKDVEPYPRVMYRYKAVSSYSPSIPTSLRTVTLEHTARFYRDKTDEEFLTNPDIIGAIKNSDLEIGWVDLVLACTDCSRWTYFLEKGTTEISCSECNQKKFTALQKQIEKIEKAITVEKNRNLVEHCVHHLGLSSTTVASYLKARGAHAREYLTKAERVEIPRFTINLTKANEIAKKPKAEWKLTSVITKDYPATFPQFADAVKLTEADWILGSVQDKTVYGEVRAAWNAQGFKIPQSPRLRGVLTALSANEATLKHFEERLVLKREMSTASAAEIVKQKKDTTNQIYFSNEPDPLFNIGVWGQGHYNSCQNYAAGGWGAGMCRTPASLLDPTVSVIWYGKPTEMLARQLVRERIHPQTKKKIWICDQHYGNGNHMTTLHKALAEYAKTKGIDVYDTIGRDYAYTENDVDFKTIGPAYFDGANQVRNTKGTFYRLGTLIGKKV